MKKTPKLFEPFIKDTIALAKKHKVEILLSEEETVEFTSESRCNGYFAGHDVGGELVVACGQPEESWLPTFVHESCHMDQWIERAPAWTDSEHDDPLYLIELWCDHKIELSKKQLNEYVRVCREVELDCEKRTAQKILDYNLPINISEYIQKANAYVYFYTMIKTTRKWYDTGCAPYKHENIWRSMPFHFYNNYEIIPPHINELYLELLK